MLIVLAPSRVLSQDAKDLDRARHYMAVAKRSSSIDTIKFYTQKASKLIGIDGDRQLQIECADNLAYVYNAERKYDSAIINYKHLYIMISDDTTRKKDMARILGSLGICYKNTDKYIDMWTSLRQSKAIFEQLHDTSKICWATIEMGEAYEHFGMYELAREQYDYALALAKASHSANDITRCYYNIGNAILGEYFDVQADSTAHIIAQARDYIMRAIGDFDYNAGGTIDMERYKSMLALSKCYMTLLKVSPQRADYADSCRFYLERYMTIQTGKTASDSLATETMKAMLMINDRRYKEAVPILENATQLPVEVEYSRDMAEVYKLLSESYTAIGKTKEAYMAKKKYNELYNKVSNDENMKRTANFAAQTELDAEREQLDQENKRQKAINDAEEIRQQIIIERLVGFFIVAAAITLIIIISLRKKHRLSLELNDRNDKLLAQRNVIAQQKNDEERAQAIILSDVEYASKIQSQATGNEDSVTTVFPESFVYYRPRNIVSGDWYMATVLRGHRIMIEADCTGHGIPGALLCMLGVSALKDIINQLRHTSTAIQPGLILDGMRTAIKKALNKDTADSKSNIDDGMDMSIVILPPSGDRLLFGGANQSAILITGGTATRLKGDANPIGNYVREKEHFTTTEVPVSDGDAVYLLSDGIQDQTGGENERKYSFKRLMDFLVEHHTLTMQQQLTLIENDIDTYAGQQPQVDDRTLVGIRIQATT